MDGLTGLRFVAAFYVLLFHLDMRTPYTFLPYGVQEILRQGALGVTLFFVLSGFILTYTYQDNSDAIHKKWEFFKVFQAKRLARIYPAYFAAIALTVVIGLASVLPENFATVFLLDTFMMNSYVPDLAFSWFGGGGWSISTEIFFYLLFPILLPIISQIQSKRQALILLILFSVLSAVPGYLCILSPKNFPSHLVTTFPLCRLAEFICGILAARLVFRFQWQVKPIVAVVALTLATLYLAKFGLRFRTHIVHHQVVVPAFVLLIASVSRFGNNSAFRWMASKPMIYLGKISYAFYLMQIPLFILVERFKEMNLISDTSFWIAPVVILLNFGLSILLFEFVEHPIHKRLVIRIKQWSGRPASDTVQRKLTPVPLTLE